MSPCLDWATHILHQGRFNTFHVRKAVTWLIIEMICVSHTALSPTALTKNLLSQQVRFLIVSQILRQECFGDTSLAPHSEHTIMPTTVYGLVFLTVSSLESTPNSRPAGPVCPRGIGAWGKVIVGISYPEEMKSGFFFLAELWAMKWAHFKARAIASSELVSHICFLLKVASMLLNKFKVRDFPGGVAELLSIRLLFSV